MKASDINIRDPFVLVHENKYYLYGTRGSGDFSNEAFGFDVYTSTDLVDFDGPFEVFHRPEGFWSKKCYWAPEVHKYKGKFYMFASFANLEDGLGTAVLVSDTPMGPFKMWSDGYVTPKNWRCLDGTFYISKDGVPYMVFCHEWKEIKDGTICAMRLSEDLKTGVEEPRTLFSATQNNFVAEYEAGGYYVTDGPFFVRTEDDRLHMIWSTYSKDGYVEAIAHSDNDEITGNWKCEDKLLFSKDGGHGMIFKNFGGEYMITLHSPNNLLSERPRFIPLKYDGEFMVN